MKALTLPQPEAALVLCGLQRYYPLQEPTDYRGPVALHAASSPPWPGWEFPEYQRILRRAGLETGAALHDLPRNCVVGFATVTDCRRTRNPETWCLEPWADRAAKEDVLANFGRRAWALCLEPRHILGAADGLPWAPGGYPYTLWEWEGGEIYLPGPELPVFELCDPEVTARLREAAARAER